jgi:basic membrane protein A and related proteins
LRTTRGLRLASLVVAGTMLFAACGDDEPTTPAAPGNTGSAPPKTDIKIGMVYDTTGRGDKSFNDAAAAGLDKAKAELGVETKDLTPSGGGENREELLGQLAEGGYGYTIAVGFLFGDSMKAVAKANPDSTFGIVDSVVDTDKEKFPNVKQLVFTEHEGSFLVGAAAGLKSKTGRVGFVGGVETDLIKKFEAGFAAGAKAANPNIKVDVKYITQEPDYTGFNDPGKGQEIGKGMYDGGADVIFAAAGGSGTGVFEAAKAASGGKTGADQMWAIGVDSDQYLGAAPALQPYILTSMVKRVDVAVFESIKKFVEGDKAGGVVVFDLKVDGVGYSKSGGFVDDIASKLDDYKKQIIDGTLKVPDKP